MDNGYCILTKTPLYLNMFQFALAISFVIKFNRLFVSFKLCPNQAQSFSTTLRSKPGPTCNCGLFYPIVTPLFLNSRKTYRT